ncbi:unnamed protein product [Mytilus edulis]|uniref:Uncharacterized protein n=1 Tax=Mytilus edulis TaxID=6550 RepID=A0A8S3PQ68_MYTED|nr:unnamed protein product [Mytilus edulis]
MLVAVAYLLQISNTLNPNSKNVCPEKLPPINDEFRNISKDAFGVKCCPNFLERNGMCEHISYEDSTVTIIISTSIPSKAIIIEETTVKYNGSSNMDWLLYTLCIAGVIVLTAFTHLLRSYQQRKSTKRTKSEKVVWESTTTSPYTGTYDEIDENVLTDNTSGLCVTAQKSRMEAVYFVPQESTYSTTITGQVKTDYLDPVFEAELEEGEKSEDQILTCSSSKVSTGTESVRSSTSKENTHEHLHGNRVPVTIHQFIESSSGVDEDTTENKCSHTYQSLLKESQISSNKYEQFQNPDSKIADNAKLHIVSQCIYGTSELPNVINHHVRNISKDAFTVKCCPDFFENNDICEPCPAGTYGKSCEDNCPHGFYGKQCTVECNCSSAQKCHRIFGCVCQVGYTGNKCDQDVTSVENTVTNVVATGYVSEAISIEETTIKNSHRPSNKEWLWYIICITGAIILTASTHLLRSYRKRKSRNTNGEAVVESTTISPHTGFYHEIDENIFNDVTPVPSLSFVSHSSKMDAVCFISQEKSFITRSTELVNTDYLDPVFAAEDDEENWQQQQLHKKDNMSTCFSVSDVIVPLSIKSVNPFKVTETQHERLHGYEVPVTVHQYIESSSGSDEDATDYKYSHVYQSLQKDSQTKNNDYEKLRTAESKIVTDESLQATTQAI